MISLVGNDATRQALLARCRAEALHHAWLFAGAAGLGRRRVGLQMAQALNCTEPAAERPCGVCPSCHRIEEGNHPDVWTVEPTGKSHQITVDQIRELQRKVALRRLEGRYRVVILEGADTMRAAAANSFLKTLEAPPQGTIFILLVEQVGATLPTIQSRCQKVRFRPVATEVLAELVEQKLGCEPDEAQLRAQLSGGAPGRALSLDLGAEESRRASLLRLVKALTGDDVDRLSLAEDLAGEREILGDLLRDLQQLLRDVAVTRHGQPALRRDLDAERAVLAARLPGPLVFSAMDHLTRAIEGRKRNLNARLMLEDLTLALAAAGG